MEKKLKGTAVQKCPGAHDERMLAVRDAMEILSGKWKIPIIGTLSFGGKMRFMDLLREVDGIAAKMLSKELQDLEMNKLVKRTVCNTKPITVEYEITPYGNTLREVIYAIASWGMDHRRMVKGQLRASSKRPAAKAQLQA